MLPAHSVAAIFQLKARQGDEVQGEEACFRPPPRGRPPEAAHVPIALRHCAAGALAVTDHLLGVAPASSAPHSRGPFSFRPSSAAGTVPDRTWMA